MIRTLKDLCYVIECAAMGYMGEGKSELSTLCDNLETNRDYAIASRVAVAAELRAALMLYRNDKRMEGASQLVRTSRKLWAVVDVPCDGMSEQ